MRSAMHTEKTTTGRGRRSFRAATCLCCLAAVTFLGCESMYLQPQELADGDFLASGVTASFFRAVQIDPRSEDTAGPQFVAAADFDNDGLRDVVSGWNQSQPIHIHLQRHDSNGNVQFLTIPIGGTTPIARIAGLEARDIDLDGFPDIIVLVKDTGLLATCDQSREDCDVTENEGVLEDAWDGGVVLFFNPGDPLNDPWVPAVLEQTFLAGLIEDSEYPEFGGYTSLAVGDVDGINGPDIVVTLNSAEGEPPLGQVNTVDFYPNPGGRTARNAEGWSRYTIYNDLPAVGDCQIADLNEDGFNDVIVTYPEARSANIRWLPNPLGLDANTTVSPYGPWPFYAPVGQVATKADVLEIGDIDGDGSKDVLVRSRDGLLVQWFKKPQSPSQTFVRNPWQVYTLAEFTEREPGAIALGDLTGNGRMDAVIAAGGAVAWFEPTTEANVFDQWTEHIIVDDDTVGARQTGASTQNADTSGLATLLGFNTDPNAGGEIISTLVNTLLIADIDGDGLNDIIATLDRGGSVGLSNDALVLLRNTRGD